MNQKSLDAVKMLKMDHKKVKALFDEFEEAKDARAKRKAAEQAILELKIHAALEEEIFYPAVRRKLGKQMADVMNEANEEHHVAKVLIAELDQLEPRDPRFEAKFMVLAENVRHHIKEEESEMLPEAEDTGIDMEALAEQMAQRKEALMAGELPRTTEEEMVTASR
jgi:hemerythrin superfamily protein